MTQFHQLGGAERMAVDLALDLNRRGIRAEIADLYGQNHPGTAETASSLLGSGVPAIHPLGMHIHPSIGDVLLAMRKLRRLIQEHRYDIVETSMVPTSTIALWATRGTRARHVAGVHQVFKRDLENSWRHKFWRFSLQCNPGTRFYAVSDHAAHRWIDFSRTPSRHTRRIYNGIDEKWFTATPDRSGLRRELALPANARVALYSGRLAAYKGIDTLLDALGPVLESEDLHLVYAGPTDPSVKENGETLERMKRRILELKLRHRVKFLGFRKDILRLVASADVLVHPSRTEGFGLALVEAMAAGTPVVASNAEGIPEVLAGTDSLMVPPDDSVALREAVLRTLRRTPGEAAAAQEKGRHRTWKLRTSVRTDAMIRLFEDVLMNRF